MWSAAPNTPTVIIMFVFEVSESLSDSEAFENLMKPLRACLGPQSLYQASKNLPKAFESLSGASCSLSEASASLCGSIRHRPLQNG